MSKQSILTMLGVALRTALLGSFPTTHSPREIVKPRFKVGGCRFVFPQIFNFQFAFSAKAGIILI
jgi:hypothetical protein